MNKQEAIVMRLVGIVESLRMDIQVVTPKQRIPPPSTPNPGQRKEGNRDNMAETCFSTSNPPKAKSLIKVISPGPSRSAKNST